MPTVSPIPICPSSPSAEACSPGTRKIKLKRVRNKQSKETEIIEANDHFNEDKKPTFMEKVRHKSK